ncbi:MAG: hypothetical protein IPO92_10110 [Saprospiraceae bacterium]|nr:hypothetical protein [Saprospiraceae bacterium]
MTPNNFDNIIRKKLDQLSPFSSDGNWTLFEKRLSSETDFDQLTNDIDFDHQIKVEVNTIHPSFKEKHWELLKSQLITIEQRMHSILVSKIMEFAGILLIVFTFFHMPDYVHRPEKSVKPVSTELQYALQNIKDVPKIISKAKQVDNSINTSDAAMVETKSSEYDKPVLRNRKPIPELKLLAASHKINLISDDNKIHQNINILPIFVNNMDQGSKKLKSEMTDEDIVTTYLPDEPDMVLEKVTIDKIVNDPKEVYSEIALSFPMELPSTVLPSKYALSVYTTADVNLINTPFDKLYSLASYNKEALNNSYGIHISTEKNNIEFETGLGYSKRIYQPEIITEAYGRFGNNYFEKSLKKITYDIVSLPLNIKYHFINNSQWSTYIMVGAALNVVMNANYGIENRLKEGKPYNRYAPDQARLDEKGFIHGVLHNDSFKDNYFASAGFGFGIEKKIANKFSMYIQPSYQRHILSSDIGIGPNKDKIHTASLQIGIKTSLN